MVTIFVREINSYFSSLLGYINVIVFLVSLGLFIWVFPDTSIMEYGYATLEPLFIISPWVFLFLIPAVTMRSFAEEKHTGTIELLVTKPISDLRIILGKYFASLFLVLFSLAPTLVYFFSISKLGYPPGNIDAGATWGSYIGLFLVGASFVSIGIFSSSLTSNQIVSFILALFLCFVFYSGFDYISELPVFIGKIDDIILLIGINSHYNSMSRGVIDTRDVVYFISFISIFILLTKIVLESRKW
ncbi:MAG: gliding motility-associated ABC transporter permease subunit GldF [Bacteroidetes bacterium]|nr:gliding motility-associated ABC transporter permease subunit GldF [Bacteroidota bacterium]